MNYLQAIILLYHVVAECGSFADFHIDSRVRDLTIMLERLRKGTR